MPEQITNVLNKVVEWWKKFNTRQRIFLISVTAVLLIALIILYLIASKPQMVELYRAADSKEAATIKELLDSDSEIDYKVDQKGLVFTVDAKDEAAASMLLGSNDFPALGYDITSVTGGSLTSTQADKERLYKDYLEKKFAAHLTTLEGVDAVEIDINIPDDNGTILSSKQESSAALVLTLSEAMSPEQAAGIAQFVATQLGNDTTEKITLMDQNKNVLFVGSNVDSVAGVLSSQLSLKEKQKNIVESEIVKIFEDSKIFSNVKVGVNLDMDFSNVEIVNKEYSTPEGQNYGPLHTEEHYEASATGGQAGVPGTDSNDDTSYMTEDDDISSSDILEYKKLYHTDEKVTTTISDGGTIKYDTSSVSVTAIRTVPYFEETLRESGALDEISYEEYKAQNSNMVLVETDEELINAVRAATGFTGENAIQVLCYEQAVFYDEPESGRTWNDILQIILAVVIFALLGFVVWRSTRSPKVEEVEPELSVEALLESTSENIENLDDIGYAEKSETRILIEKFVEENPDAVAILLRNWLNEEWE